MLGRKLTIEQKELIHGKFFTSDTFFNCRQDVMDEWYIMLSNQDEDEISINEKYMWVLSLPLSEFVPPISPDVP